jgi:hypothetical protein
MLPVDELRLGSTVNDGLVRVLKAALLDAAFRDAKEAILMEMAWDEDKANACHSVATLRDGTDVTCYEFGVAVANAWLACAPNGVTGMWGHVETDRELQKNMSIFDKTLSFAHAILDPIRSVALSSGILARLPELVYVAVLEVLISDKNARVTGWWKNDANVETVSTRACNMSFTNADSEMKKKFESSVRILASLFGLGITADIALENLKHCAKLTACKSTLYRSEAEMSQFFKDAAILQSGPNNVRCVGEVNGIIAMYTVQTLVCKISMIARLARACYVDKHKGKNYSALSTLDLHGAWMWSTVLAQLDVVFKKFSHASEGTHVTAEALRLYVYLNRIDGKGAMDAFLKVEAEQAIKHRIATDGTLSKKRSLKRTRETPCSAFHSFL